MDIQWWSIGPSGARRQIGVGVRVQREMSGRIEREGRACQAVSLAVVLTGDEPVGQDPEIR